LNIWDLDKLFLFIMFVVPGFISLKAYELFIPSQPKDSSKQIIDAITYSSINYALLFFFIVKVELSGYYTTHQNLYYLFYFSVLFLSPVVLVLIWKWIRSTNIAQKNAPHPTGKPWDYVFSQRKSYWVKVVKNDGTVIGGKYSEKSFASSAPASEQIYLEEAWVINDNGGFERVKNNSAGVIILTDDISHIELRNYGD